MKLSSNHHNSTMYTKLFTLAGGKKPAHSMDSSSTAAVIIFGHNGLSAVNHRYAIARPDKVVTDPMVYGGKIYGRRRGYREESRE